MPISVTWPEVACVDSRIFLFDSCKSMQLLQLDTITKTWRTEAKPPQQKYNGARMISVDGQLLICGGANKAFAQYTPSTDTWTTGNAPTLQHDLGALVHHDQKLYLIGGSGEDRVEEYDLGTKAWAICDARVPTKLYNLYAICYVRSPDTEWIVLSYSMLLSNTNLNYYTKCNRTKDNTGF